MCISVVVFEGALEPDAGAEVAGVRVCGGGIGGGGGGGGIGGGRGDSPLASGESASSNAFV